MFLLVSGAASDAPASPHPELVRAYAEYLSRASFGMVVRELRPQFEAVRLREKHGSTSRIVNVFRFSFVTITKHILHPSVCQDTVKQQIHTSH